jgi:hypothetical protein
MSREEELNAEIPRRRRGRQNQMERHTQKRHGNCGTERGRDAGQGGMEKENYQPHRRPQMIGKVREELHWYCTDSLCETGYWHGYLCKLSLSASNCGEL